MNAASLGTCALHKQSNRSENICRYSLITVLVIECIHGILTAIRSFGGGPTINVSLTPELNNFVEEKVKGGLYHSASEVIREGLRLLKERDTLHAIREQESRNQVREGFAQIDRGECLEFS